MFSDLIGQYVVVRGSAMGVHAGVLEAVEGDTVRLQDARRLWRWWAAKSISLSGVALHGLADRSECRIGGTVPVMVARDWCEILPCSQQAQDSLRGFAESGQ